MLERKLDSKEIEEKANNFANKYNFNSQKDDISDLVRKLGGEIKISDSPKSLHIYNDNFVIYLRPFTGILKDNFSIAHELGHISLHYPEFFNNSLKEEIVVNRFEGGKLEHQANRFAALLLMPVDIFIKLGNNTNFNIPYMSSRFSVSQDSIKIWYNVLKKEERL
jgi:Zn-dependent peptidase ImmA (M78 family)